MYGTLYRHVLFPFFESAVKGRKTVEHWRQFEESQWWPLDRHQAAQLQALQKLIRHAWDTCPYYHDEWERRGLYPSRLQAFSDLHAWPLVQRDAIRDNRLRMRTTAPCRLMSKSTGGSSGEPLHFDLDMGSHARRTALMHRGYGWAGGAPGTKQLFIWGGPLSLLPPHKRWKQLLHARLERKKIVNCFEFTPELMHRHLLTLNRYRPDVIVAYTNPVYEFARYLEAEGLKPFSPTGIIVGAEKLHGFQRELIERVFGAPVFETYGAREVMLIGAECEKHEGLHLSLENLYVEILNDDGTPTQAGEEGNVVVTDLFNYGMPFIRYVNGDRAVAGWKKCSCGRDLPLLSQVTGRRLDTLVTPDGRKVPGEFFPHLIKEFPDVRRFQVVQQACHNITMTVVAPGFTREQQQRLLDAVRSCTGESVGIDLQLVADIPLTKSGKHKVVVRNV
jgi:phenylacetate-CoA ligase